ARGRAGRAGRRQRAGIGQHAARTQRHGRACPGRLDTKGPDRVVKPVDDVTFGAALRLAQAALCQIAPVAVGPPCGRWRFTASGLVESTPMYTPRSHLRLSGSETFSVNLQTFV